MNERLKEHVEELFLGTPHTRQAADVKEELLANLQAKYDDMLGQGKTEDEAYENVISSIGDIRSLLGETPEYNTENVSAKRQASNIIKAVAIMLMIFSIVPTIILNAIFEDTWLWWLTPVSFISIIAVAVGLLIISLSVGPKKYKKGDDTFVEVYKEKVSGNNKEARLKGAISSTLWTTVLILYLIISITTGAWHITWLIFIIGGLVQNVVRFVLDNKSKGYKQLVNSTIWLAALVMYFLISFSTGAWAWTLIIFVIALLATQVFRLIDVWREEE